MDKNRKNSMPVVRVFVPAIFVSVAALDSSEAAVLPEDRTDILYHAYDGGGITIDGPSVLVRKSLGKSLSLTANHYVDSVSSASIDVEVHASAYEEERTEHSLGVDYLIDRTIVSFGHTVSSENDYEASTGYISISQDFFGDLTTLSMNYAKGWDEVGRRGDESFAEEADRHVYGLGLTQVLTKNLIVGLSAEHISDQGYLNNPYRSVRFVDTNSPRGFGFTTEVYPDTRTSNAVSLNANYYLPYRAALYADFRWYNDTWGISASNGKLGYIHTIGDEWIIDVYTRFYSQDKADFYQDLFARPDELTSWRAIKR